MTSKKHRAEFLNNEIENTNEEIKSFQLVIQKLDGVMKGTKNLEARKSINELINSFDVQVNFLENTKEADEEYLNCCLNNKNEVLAR